MPVPVEADPEMTSPEDPWILAATAFGPSYIGGWSAAEHWGLTEQLFRTIVVLSSKPPRSRKLDLAGTPFWIIGIQERAMFGLKPVWRGNVRVQVSDPTRTVLDMLSNPLVGGGLRSTVDIVRAYLSSEHYVYSTLKDYAQRLDNGAVYKRLGFLLEKYQPQEKALIETCRRNLTAGLTQLDPALKGTSIVKRWRIRIPKAWGPEAKR